MSMRIRNVLLGALLGLGLWVVWAFPSDAVTLVLLWLTAPPATAYALLLATTTRWWTRLSGWALLTFGAGFALLVDLSLAYRILGNDYQAHDASRLLAFSVCAVGAWLKFITVVRDKIRDRRH